MQIIDPVGPETGKKLRVCAYCRVSTESLSQEDSLENQQASFEREIRENPEYEYCGVYADQGISGSRQDRPEFQRMIRDARAGMFDLIITKSISRFARNTVIMLETVRELKACGVGVLFQEQNINTLSGAGELMMTVEAAFAQEELRSMSNNNKWSMRKRFQQGKVFINTARFLGYDKNEYGELVINPEQAELVRRIFNMYLKGMGTHRIAAALNKESVPSLTGKRWTQETILDMLKNEKYKGDCLLQKTYTRKIGHSSVINQGTLDSYYLQEDHEPIIAPADWERVQELMMKRKEQRHIETGTHKYRKRYPQSGNLLCPYCGKPLKRRIVNGRHVQWWCSTYMKRGKQTCPGIKVPDEEVQKIKEPTIVEEVIDHGQKHYRYTSKSAAEKHSEPERITKIESGCLLPRLDRDGRTIIKL
jgi:DNA invertase Pin-like site-specific DNA recombinase